jgi:asparagine synthetase B (glutamine-hydrolysing)
MAALEEAVSDAVRKTPCCVAFSGGRDSSLLLAAAVRSAAKQGRPPPLAATVRFTTSSEANEDAWQELVLEHLGVEERIVIDVEDELDFVGPVATAELVRRGVLFPPNSHSLAPLLAAAAGGSLLVGAGGDELLGARRWAHLNDALAARRRMTWRDVGRLSVAALPGVARGRMLARGEPVERSWLQPAAARRVRALERRAADEPVRFDRAVVRASRHRATTVGRASLRLIGDAAGITVQAPLLDPRFVAAIARAGGARGWSDRSATMRAVASGILPEAVLDRPDKARFNPTFFGEATRRFAEQWSGEGVDPSLVVPEALRSAWLEPDPSFHSALLLQRAWLHDHGSPA